MGDVGSSSDSQQGPPKTGKRKKEDVQPLKRNSACLNCRRRKLRCDGLRPTCKTCSKSRRYALEHLKAGIAPPPCEWEEEGAPRPPPVKRAKAVARNESGQSSAEAGPSRPPGVSQGEPSASSSNLNLAPPSGPIVVPSSTASASFDPSDSYGRSFLEEAETLASLPWSLGPQQASPATVLDTFPSRRSVPQSSSHASGMTLGRPFDIPPSNAFSVPSPASSTTHLGASHLQPSRWAFGLPDSPDKSRTPTPPDKGTKREEPAVVNGIPPGMDFSEKAMTDLFWPGWPPHLPAPTMMSRVVNTFFGCAHLASNILNKGKLLRCLALPPTHQEFPNPCLLHAICAATSRFLGEVYNEPPMACAFPKANVPHQQAHRNALADPYDKRPSWDGMGSQAPPSARANVDSDFGTIHATWAKMYIDEQMRDASAWMSIVQALTLLAHAHHQNARWSEGWDLTARACRLLTPLGLHLNDIPNFVQQLFAKPEDPITVSERQNLFWALLSVDTLSSAASGWPGCLDDRVVTCLIPACAASDVCEANPQQEPSQSIRSFRIFHEHTPGASSTPLAFKSVLLLRRVHEFLRLAKTIQLTEPRETAEFRRLDELLTTFRASFPPEHRNPVRFVQNSTAYDSIDLDLVTCHVVSLAAVIQLHETFAKVFKESDHSLLRMLAASRGLIAIIHQLTATSFDLSRLPPFATFSWFLAARCLSFVLRRAVKTGDKGIEDACRTDMELLITTMLNVGARIPIGVRQAAMCSAILRDIGGAGISKHQVSDLCLLEFQNSLGLARSSTDGGTFDSALVNRALEHEITLIMPHSAGSSPPPSNWVEALTFQVLEEGRTLNNPLEGIWEGASEFTDILQYM